MKTRDEHRKEAVGRLLASDWQWQQAGDTGGDLGYVYGSIREALVAVAEALLAMSAPTSVLFSGDVAGAPWETAQRPSDGAA